MGKRIIVSTGEKRVSVLDFEMLSQGWGGLTHHVDGARFARQAAGIVLDDVAGFVDALDGARFDVELIVAETLFPST